MMEVVNTFYATVYRRVNVRQPDDIEDCGQLVKWKVDFRIKRFPKLLAQQSSVPFLFSPNFTYQFDINFKAKRFDILCTANRHIYMKLPADLLSTEWNNLDNKQALQLICSRFKWETERRFRVINRGNFDCLFEMCSTDPLDRDVSSRYLRLVSTVKIDNLHENQIRLDS